MAKTKPTTELVPLETEIGKLVPAAVIGTATKIDLPASALPAEFGGVELETIETGFDPTVRWQKPGDFVAGVYEKTEADVGPNKSKLYTFRAKDRTFGVWGTTVLDRAFEGAIAEGTIKPGYLVAIIYAGDVETDYNPCKIFHIKVAKKK